jgi:hypothetical protein
VREYSHDSLARPSDLSESLYRPSSSTSRFLFALPSPRTRFIRPCLLLFAVYVILSRIRRYSRHGESHRNSSFLSLTRSAPSLAQQPTAPCSVSLPSSTSKQQHTTTSSSIDDVGICRRALPRLLSTPRDDSVSTSRLRFQPFRRHKVKAKATSPLQHASERTSFQMLDCWTS